MRERVFVAYQRLKVATPMLRRAVRSIPGAYRLHRRMYEGIRPAEVLVEVNGFTMVVDPRDEVLGAHLIHGKPWEPYESKLFIDSIEPGMVVVDVGANIGYYTLLAARAVGPEGAVLALEPDPVNFQLLTRNVAANGVGQRVTAIQCAVADRSGTVTLFHDYDNFGAHSLAEDNLVGVGSVEVPCSTLAEALKGNGLDHVDVLKIDVQGAEGQVFHGAEGTLGCDGVRIFMEYWPSGLRRLGTDPAQLLRMLASQYQFQISWIDEQRSQLAKLGDPQAVITHCGASGHVNLVLEHT